MKLIFNSLPRRLPPKCIAGAFSHVSNRKTCWIVRVLWDIVVSYSDIKWWKSMFCVYGNFESLTVLPFENTTFLKHIGSKQHWIPMVCICGCAGGSWLGLLSPRTDFSLPVLITPSWEVLSSFGAVSNSSTTA